MYFLLLQITHLEKKILSLCLINLQILRSHQVPLLQWDSNSCYIYPVCIGLTGAHSEEPQEGKLAISNLMVHTCIYLGIHLFIGVDHQCLAKWVIIYSASEIHSFRIMYLARVNAIMASLCTQMYQVQLFQIWGPSSDHELP